MHRFTSSRGEIATGMLSTHGHLNLRRQQFGQETAEVQRDANIGGRWSQTSNSLVTYHGSCWWRPCQPMQPISLTFWASQKIGAPIWVGRDAWWLSASRLMTISSSGYGNHKSDTISLNESTGCTGTWRCCGIMWRRHVGVPIKKLPIQRGHSIHVYPMCSIW